MREPAYNSLGVQVGEYDQADDGSIVAIGYDGRVLAAWSPEGVALDPDEFETSGPPPTPPADPLTTEQRESGWVGDDDLAPHWRGTLDEIGRQTEDLKRRLGRKLTPSEGLAIAEVLDRQLEQGHEPDVGYALEFAQEHKLAATYDRSNTDDRVAIAVEQLDYDNQAARDAEPKRPLHEIPKDTTEDKIERAVRIYNGESPDPPAEPEPAQAA